MFPKFIGIGAQRSGSTWVARNLRFHPGIWLSPIKELHYFDGKKVGIPEGVWRKYFTQQWPHKRFRRLLLSRLKAKLTSCRLNDWEWDYRFFLSRQNDNWYASLFDQGLGKCTGEITPAYSILDEGEVNDIYRLMPDSKIIFMMRDPIDRSWSQAVKEFTLHKKRQLNSVTDEEWVECFTHRRVVLRSDYLRTLDIWQRFYRQEQMFVGFFEDIVDRPAGLLMEIYQFLGVDTDEKYIPAGLGNKVNAGTRTVIPQKWEKFLAHQYHDQVREINQRYAGRAKDWLVRADRVQG